MKLRIPYDKQLHFIGGCIIALVVGLLLSDAVAGAVVAAIVGLLKEGYDYLHPKEHTVEAADALYTLLGGVVGAVIAWGCT